jgi:predicted RNA-binding Zn ribbon-like protein
VDFGDYRDDTVGLAVDLVNTHEPSIDPGADELASVEDLVRFLGDHGLEGWAGYVTRRDLDAVKDLRGRLRDVFAAPDTDAAAERLNDLLATSELRPQLSNHGGKHWHLHVTSPEKGVVAHVRAVSALALSMVLAEHGKERLGMCAERTCEDVYVDTSKNSSRRYCSEVCANRANVRAHRARSRGPQ